MCFVIEFSPPSSALRWSEQPHVFCVHVRRCKPCACIVERTHLTAGRLVCCFARSRNFIALPPASRTHTASACGSFSGARKEPEPGASCECRGANLRHLTALAESESAELPPLCSASPLPQQVLRCCAGRLCEGGLRFSSIFASFLSATGATGGGCRTPLHPHALRAPVTCGAGSLVTDASPRPG